MNVHTNISYELVVHMHPVSPRFPQKPVKQQHFTGMTESFVPVRNKYVTHIVYMCLHTGIEV